MEFDQFKKSLDTEARKENDMLKKEIADLKMKLKNSVTKEKYELLEGDVEALSERCYIMSKGLLCGFCSFNEFKCPHTKDLSESMEEFESLYSEELSKTNDDKINEPDTNSKETASTNEEHPMKPNSFLNRIKMFKRTSKTKDTK